MRNRNIRNKLTSVYLIFGMVLLVIGFSYAFFIYNKTGLYTHTITGGKIKVIYDEEASNNILIENAYPRNDEEALTYGLEFEFTVTGYNESEKNVYYAIEIDYGEDLNGKNRFLDTDIKLSLYENEEIVFENEIFNNLDNQDIHYSHFNYGTSSDTPEVNNYKLRLWINDNVIISDTLSDDLNSWGNYEWDWLYENYPAKYEEVYNGDDLYLSDYGISVYTSEEFSNSYANFKVNIKADLTYDDIGYLTYDANGGEFDITRSSLLTGMITTKKPLMENKGFLGWSTKKDAAEPEYKAGERYTGKEQVLFAVYSDTRNVMSDLSAFSSYNGTIKEVHFINDTQSNIDERYNNSSLAVDLTLDNQGSVKGWLEVNSDNDNILYIGSYGTTYLSTGEELFYGYNYTSIFDFSNVDTSMVTSMANMFQTKSNPTEPDKNELIYYKQNDLIYNPDSYDYFKELNTETESNLGILDLSMFNTSNVTIMSNMFMEFGNLYYVDLSSFDTSKVENMSSMFRESLFNELEVGHFDTSEVTKMDHMFRGLDKLFELDVSDFDTSKVTDMSRMFYYCDSVQYLDLSKFDTSLVTDMEGMFYCCKSLYELDLTSFDVSKVTKMSSMFYYCSNLQTIYANYDWNTGTVTSSYTMFTSCTNLAGAISYSITKFDVTYANPDTGYFTRKYS